MQTPTPHNDGRANSTEELAKFAIELQEHEIKHVGQIVAQVQFRYQYKEPTARNLENLRDEVLNRLANYGVLASFDPTPCIYGESPVLDIVGRIGDPGFQKATDHEQKAWGVQKAVERGEDYLGQTGEANAVKAQKRAKKRK